MTLQELCQMTGKSENTLKNSFNRTKENLAKKGILTLNKRLLEAPRNCIEYVVMHELCHFIQPNHSKHFYSFLTMLMPDWKERKVLLEKTAAYWLQVKQRGELLEKT